MLGAKWIFFASSMDDQFQLFPAVALAQILAQPTIPRSITWASPVRRARLTLASRDSRTTDLRHGEDFTGEHVHITHVA